MNCVLFAKMDQVFSKENKTLKKILENWKKKYWKSQGILSVRKSGNPVVINDRTSSPDWSFEEKTCVKQSMISE